MEFLEPILFLFLTIPRFYCDDIKGDYGEPKGEIVFIRDTGELLFDPRVNRDFIPGDNHIFDAILATLPRFLANKTLPGNILDAFGLNPLDLLSDVYPLPKGLYEPYDEYDYVIVGAGSTGSVLAARLSEDGKNTVLLLEQGKTENVLTDVPFLLATLPFTNFVEPYFYESTNGSCQGMRDQRCFLPRGRVVGGNSVTNFIVYLRALPDDLDRLAADGNYGWSYKEILPYFKRSERAFLKDEKYSKIHGTKGELNVEETPFRSILAARFLEAVILNGGKLEDYQKGRGFSYAQATLRNGRRCSAAKAFLHPNRFRHNLLILPEAKVLKVDINEEREAESVQYVWQKKRRTVKARKEIIITAGPIASPQLLMLSGIGPKRHLESVGINVVKDLKVGQTLYEYTSYPGQCVLVNKTGTTFVASNVLTVQNLGRYILFHEGPLASPAGIEVLGYITTLGANYANTNDIQLLFLPTTLLSDGGFLLANMLNIDSNYYRAVFGENINAESYGIGIQLVKPKSKGYIKLQNADPYSHPIVVGNFLSDRRDVKAYIEAIRYANKLALAAPFQQFNPRLLKHKFPNCPNLKYDSDEYWECAIRSLVYSLRQPIGTCKMGIESDIEAVVDSELRVYGIKNLRVAGNCVIPHPLGGFSNGNSLAIGEKCADLIKATWTELEMEK